MTDVPHPRAGVTVRPGREPTQRRSRERRERILAAASARIAEHGSDAMRMSDVAEAAGVSIGSLYQYFPDKAAVLAALAAAFNAETRRCVAEALGTISDARGLRTAFAALFDTYYQLVRTQPVVRDIWAGMQADKLLAAAQLAESRAMGALLAATIARTQRRAVSERVETAAFLLWELGETAVRLAVSTSDDEGARLVRAYRRMAVRELDVLTKPSRLERRGR